MVIDCQTNLTGRLSALELAEFNDAVGNADAYFLLASPETAAMDDANQLITDFVTANPKAMGFAVVNPLREANPAGAAAEQISMRGIKGVAVYCPHIAMHPMHSKAMELYKWAQKSRVPVFFYNSSKLPQEAVLDYSQPVLIDQVAREYPELKIIIGNAGRPFVDQTIAVIGKNPNVYATISIQRSKIWSAYNTIIRANEAEVLEKFLFCSNYPESSLNQCMESLLGFNRAVADTKLPLVPLDKIRNIINRNSISLLSMQ